MKAKFFKFTQCPFVNPYFYPLLLLLIICCITATIYLSLLECFLIENTALLIAINPMSTAAYDISIACVARILNSNLVHNQIISISQAGFEWFQGTQNMENNAKALIWLDEKVNRSAKLLQLVEQMHRDVAAFSLKILILCLSAIAPCIGTCSLNQFH